MIKKAFSSSVAALYALCTALTALIAVLLHGGMDFYLKHYASAPLMGNLPLAAIALLLLGAVWLLARRVGVARIERLLARGGWLLVLLLALVTAMAQAFVAYHTYFLSSWDARYVVDGAHALAGGNPGLIDAAYFSLYPNNAVLMAIYGLIGRCVNVVLGAEMGKERFALLLILMQIGVNAATGVALWAFVRGAVSRLSAPGMSRAHTAAFGAWLLYLPLVACSPWFLVPYSDSTALLIPMLSLLLMLWRGEGRRAAAIAFAVGLLGGLGFLIKPQTAIVLIAAAMVDLASLIADAGAEKKRAAALRLAAMAVGAVLMLVPVRSMLLGSTQLALEDGKAVGAAHFLNMGLNEQTGGAFSYDDLLAAQAAPAQERTAWCLFSAGDRVREMGLGGLAAHSAQKSLINFSDGGFAWGVDFAMQLLEEKSALSAPLRSLVYTTGEAYPFLLTLQQGVWLLVLMLAPFAARGAWRRADSPLACALLSVLGILAFNMLFEAKARYMLLFAPVMIALAAIALSLPRGGFRRPSDMTTDRP